MKRVGCWRIVTETFGSGGSQLRRLGRNDTELTTLRSELSVSSVRSLMEDEEGSLWVGTDADGLLQLRNGRAVSYPIFDEPSSAGSIVEDGEGGLWVGLPCDGIAHLSSTGQRLYESGAGLEETCIWSLLRDTEGVIWAGTFGRGLLRFDGEQFRPHGAPDRGVFSLFQTSDEIRLAGTDRGGF